MRYPNTMPSHYLWFPLLKYDELLMSLRSYHFSSYMLKMVRRSLSKGRSNISRPNRGGVVGLYHHTTPPPPPTSPLITIYGFNKG